MLNDVQAIVDDLGEDIDRSVLVEDDRHTVIAYSPQRHPMDVVRERSIILRETPREAIEWVERAGLHEAVGPLRVAAAPEIGAESRLCVPIRAAGSVLGYLIILDPEQSLDEEQVARCAESGEMLCPLLREMQQAQEDGFAQTRVLVDALLSPRAADAAAREQARTALVEDGRLLAGDLAVVVIKPAWSGPGRPAADRAASLNQIVGRVRRACPPGAVAATTRTDHAICLMSLEVPAQRTPADAAARAHHAVEPLVLSGLLSPPPVVGYGDRARTADDVPVSHQRAGLAIRVAGTLNGAGQATIGWEQLGVYQLLAQVPPEALGRTAIDERVLRLLDKPEFIRTLEVYLDLAGDAKRTAEHLALHRASLYYRLGKIEEIVEIDLRSGEDRLAAHLSLKALRLAGALPH